MDKLKGKKIAREAYATLELHSRRLGFELTLLLVEHLGEGRARGRRRNIETLKPTRSYLPNRQCRC